MVGTTGSGKTTLASALAKHLGAPHVELDGLFWKPDWVQADGEQFRTDVLAATAGPRWTACGNYSRKLGMVLWERADTVVWLDPPLSLLLWRILRRTVTRSVRRTQLWAGNREKVSNLWRKDSLLRWAIQTHPQHRAAYMAATADPRWAHLTIVRLRSPRTVRRWLRATVG